MGYRENVDDLCRTLGISNDPKIPEDKLNIAMLIFYDSSSTLTPHVVEATDMNRAGRLFVEDYAWVRDHERFGVGLATRIRYGKAFRGRAEEFFAEIWGDFSPEKRSLLYGIATYNEVEIVWKDI